MSRGIDVTYIASDDGLATITSPQEFDVAIIKTEDRISPLVVNDIKKNGKIYQFTEGEWVDISDSDVTWNDSDLIGNVSKIRKVHMDDLRNVSAAFIKTFAKRCGEEYTGIHNLSKATSWWTWNGGNALDADGGFYSLAIKDYGASKKWLTLMFGGTNTGTDNDSRVRFTYRSTDGLQENPVLDILPTIIRAHTDVDITESLTTKDLVATGETSLKDTTVTGSLETTGEAVALKFKSTATGIVPPLTVASKAKVVNLTSDTVDNIHFRDNDGVLEWSLDEGSWTVLTPVAPRPYFIPPITVAETGDGLTYSTENWYQFILPSTVPNNVKSVILETQYSQNGPDGGDIDSRIWVRQSAAVPYAYMLCRARAAGSGDSLAGSNQGYFPVDDSTKSFQWMLEPPGFNRGGFAIYVIGYFA